MLIDPGDWIEIDSKGDIKQCMFDDVRIREYAREKEKEEQS